MKDSVRYKLKKIKGKSGDSGDEIANDDTSKDGDESNDLFAFLTPTSSRLPRQTITMGVTEDLTTTQASASNQKIIRDGLPDEDTRWPHEFVDDEESKSSKSSVYSFVSIYLVNLSCCIFYSFTLNFSIH